MPDAASIIKADHRHVEALFDRYNKGGGDSVVSQICSELTVHTAIEEEVLYPALADVPGGDDLRREAEHEHQEVKDAISAIQGHPGDAASVKRHMHTIIEGVTHHVQEEEHSVLPRMQDALGQARMQNCGKELLAAKHSRLVATGILADVSKEELYALAQAAKIPGRSDMTKAQLIDALQAR